MALFRQNTISDNVIPTMHSINNRSSEMHANIGLISILKLFVDVMDPQGAKGGSLCHDRRHIEATKQSPKGALGGEGL